MWKCIFQSMTSSTFAIQHISSSRQLVWNWSLACSVCMFMYFSLYRTIQHCCKWNRFQGNWAHGSLAPHSQAPEMYVPSKRQVNHENRKHNTEPSCLFSQGSPGHNCPGPNLPRTPTPTFQGSFQACMSSLNPALPPETDGFEVTNMHLICMNHSQIVPLSTVVNPISSWLSRKSCNWYIYT